MALPKFFCFPKSHKFRLHRGKPGLGLLIHKNKLKEPTADIKEVLMGNPLGDTAAPGLSEEQRRHLLGQCIDINLLACARAYTPQSIPTLPPQSRDPDPTCPTNNITVCPRRLRATPLTLLTQPPPDLSHLPTLDTTPGPPNPNDPPDPIAWTPFWTPEQWVYTDGSKIDPNPKLGAAVIQPLASTEIIIDATGIEENNTILRA